MSSVTPAYLLTLFDQNAYLGGVMLTDDHGIPLDFKYTDPVVPTKVQRIIYGKVLEQYIRNHVIIGALSRELSQQPSFFVVSQHQIHEIGEANNLDLVSLQRTKLAPLGEKGAVTRSRENESIIQPHQGEHPIRVVFDEAMAFEKQEGVIKELLELSRHMDVVEPLERLEQALKTLCVEKSQDLM